MPSSSLCGLFGCNPNHFISDIERAHRGGYKNPNLPIYVNFISWKVSWTVLLTSSEQIDLDKTIFLLAKGTLTKFRKELADY